MNALSRTIVVDEITDYTLIMTSLCDAGMFHDMFDFLPYDYFPDRLGRSLTWGNTLRLPVYEMII